MSENDQARRQQSRPLVFTAELMLIMVVVRTLITLLLNIDKLLVMVAEW